MSRVQPPSPSEQAAECRQLAQVASDLCEIRRLLHLADELDEQARLGRRRELR